MLRTTCILGAALGLTLLLSAPVGATPDGWHAAMKDGLEAAKKSNKPVLVITLWGPGT